VCSLASVRQRLLTVFRRVSYNPYQKRTGDPDLPIIAHAQMDCQVLCTVYLQECSPAYEGIGYWAIVSGIRRVDCIVPLQPDVALRYLRAVCSYNTARALAASMYLLSAEKNITHPSA